MIIHSIPQRQLYGRALSIGISTDVTLDVVRLFHLWCSKSGYEWTVNRFKSVKQDIISYCAQDAMPSSPWIARNKRGYFKGSFGFLMKYAKQSTKCLHRVLTLLNMFGVVVSDCITSTQRNKFVQAVTTPSCATPERYLTLLGKACSRFRTNASLKPAIPFILHAPFEESREKRAVREVIDFFSTAEGIEFIKQDYVVLQPLMSLFGFPGPRFTDKTPYIGGVFCTQNPGLKARFFASPNLWLQHVLSPLGDKIYDIVKDMPWDCTFDQEKPDSIIQSHLRSGSICWSFDLSSATDRFPFDLQLHVLRSILSSPMCTKFIDFYERIQKMPYNFYGSPLIWERGQALGMYPSFGLFTLTHGLLLFALNGFKHDNKFFVLGDDMIILDAKLAEDYQAFLLECDVPFNKEKSISSNSIAEFAGKMYTSDRVKVIPKWKPLNKQNCLDMIKNWGQSLIPMFPKKHQDLLLRISELPYPYGCGFNPRGLTMDQRFEGFEDLLVPEEKNLEYSTNTRSLVMERILHNTDLRSNRRVHYLLSQIDLSTAFDKNTAERIKNQDIFFVPDFLPIMGKNIYTQNPDLNLPLVGKAKSSKSTQDRFSRILKDVANKLQ
jgi:hypothetical protein